MTPPPLAFIMEAYNYVPRVCVACHVTPTVRRKLCQRCYMKAYWHKTLKGKRNAPPPPSEPARGKPAPPQPARGKIECPDHGATMSLLLDARGDDLLEKSFSREETAAAGALWRCQQPKCLYSLWVGSGGVEPQA